MELMVAGDAQVLSPEEERMLIRDITASTESSTKEGDTFYLITHRWWQCWLDYVTPDVASTSANGSHQHEAANETLRRPSFIDNADLIDNAASELHENLVEGRDYILLPEEAWQLLHGWYGGGPVLQRRAINTGLSQTDLAIEVYPLRLLLLLTPKEGKAVVRISKKDTLAELHKKACNAFNLMPDQVFIWDYYGQQKHALMDNLGRTLDDANIQNDQEILVEILSDANERRSNFEARGAFSAAENQLSNCYAPPSSELDAAQTTNGIVTRGAAMGLTGLHNLGNTCYMNTAIQCLVHTPEFAKYFREDYQKEINSDNPLGTVGGELAMAFGELLRKLWSPGRTPVSPRPFKTKLGRFTQQFDGYNQHDSQELLAYLLDGLHEDLNRVKDKPYVNSKDADGRSDEEVADEYWANHIARNDSIIVDVCQGQYRSTLVCPICGKVSVTFDPFMYLSLPLQSASSLSMTFMILTSDGSAPPTPLTVSVPKQGRFKDLAQTLSTSCSMKSGQKLVIAEIRGSIIHQFMEDSAVLLSTIKDDDRFVVYKIPKLEKRAVALQFVHRRQDFAIGSSGNSAAWRPFGVPFVTQILRNETITGSDVHQMLRKMMLPMLRNKEDVNTEIKLEHQIDSSSKEISECDVDYSQQRFETSNEYEALLQLVDVNNASIEPTDKVMKIPPSCTSLCIFVNWSKIGLKRFSTHHLENIPEVVKNAPAPKRTRSEPLSLYACLDAFLREEPLVPEDMWYCPKCQQNRQASKKLDLWRLPDVLVIHLKRFSFSRSTKQKLETFVNFPIRDLDLTNYVANKNSSQSKIYELYALSNHYGSMASGHYTAHIKLLDENRWYNFDDNHVSPMSEDDVKSAAAYVLFYRRVKTESNEISNGATALAKGK